jgi:AraC-like DNA-binding protein
MSKYAQLNQAYLWKPDAESELSLFKAQFTTFEYAAHGHEEYAIGVIESGVQHFRHKGTSWESVPFSSLVTVNPEDVHDGKAATESYSYRMMYVGIPFLRSLFEGEFEQNGFHGFMNPLTKDPALARRFVTIHRQLEQGEGRVDELLAPFLFNLFNRHAKPRPLSALDAVCHKAMQLAVEHIRGHVDDTPSLDTLAKEAGLSKYHFLRMFRKATGYTPHAYGLRYRVRLARKALENGATPSEAALDFGFSDQSHLTRCFKSTYGVTPGAFARTI